MGKIGVLGCLGIVVVLAIVVGLAAMGINNNLVGLGQGVDAQWSNVENSYQRRADLIPNLVATVQGAANFERSTLEAVVQARASVGQMKVTPEVLNDPAAFQRFQQSQDALSGALQRLMVVVEQYPDIKANANFRDLQAQLEGTENRIAVERGRYNETAQAYNTTLLKFPTNLFARFLGFKEKAYFHSAAGADQAPKVNFNFGSPTPAPAATPAH
jgi:LemA protein